MRENELLEQLKNELYNYTFSLEELSDELIKLGYEDIYDYDISRIIENESVSLQLEDNKWINIEFKIVEENKNNPKVEVINIDII